MRNTKQFLEYREYDHIYKVNTRTISNRGIDRLLHGAFDGLHPKRESMRDLLLGYWVFGYTEFVANTVSFVLSKAYNHYRIRHFSREMVVIMKMWSLMTMFENGRNAEGFTRILSLTSERDFRRPPQIWGSHGEPRVQ